MNDKNKNNIKIYYGIIIISLLLIGLSLGFIIGVKTNKNGKVIYQGTIHDSDYVYPYSYDDYSIPEGDQEGFRVIYKLMNGHTLESTTVNNCVIKPENPEKICATFINWYSDEYYNDLFDFSVKVNKDITLYAKYEIDYKSLSNYIYEYTIKSSVRVYAEGYYYINQFINEEISSSLGSGVIINEDNKYYYVLTNNHVIYKPSEANVMKYYILDCYNEQYDATLIYNSNSYDLALLRITKNSKYEKLNVIKFRSEAPDITGEEIITMGNPEGLINAISYGVINNYDYFKVKESDKDRSNVTFKVLTHSAYINSGSSGGALLDTNLELCGINFADGSSEDGSHLISYSIPIDKVNEFLDLISN